MHARALRLNMRIGLGNRRDIRAVILAEGNPRWPRKDGAELHLGATSRIRVPLSRNVQKKSEGKLLGKLLGLIKVPAVKVESSVYG